MSLAARGFGLAAIRAINAALGFVLSVGLATVFGVSREVDAMFVAMSVCVFMARDLAGAIRTGAVPCLVEDDEGVGSPDFVASLQVVVLLLAFGAAVATVLAAPLIVLVTAPGFDRAATGEACAYLRVLAPSLAVFLLIGAIQGRFYAKRRFFVPEVGETFWRLAAIVALFAVGRKWGLAAFSVALAAVAFAQFLLAEAALSYLGLGPPPPAATWGRMLYEGRVYYRSAPWLILAPGVASVIAVIGFNLLAEGLRARLEPRR